MEYPLEALAFVAAHEMQPGCILDGEARACLWRIRMILAMHNKLDRFGIHLLDNKFDLEDNESLVEYTYTAERKLVSVAMLSSDAPRTIEIMWRFDVDATGLCYRRCARSCINWGGTPQPIINRPDIREEFDAQ